MTTYKWTENGFVDKKTNEPMDLPEREIQAPLVMNDVPEYRSPVTGELITSRSQRMEDLKKHGCVEAGDWDVTGSGGKARNKKFARKHGLKWMGD